MPADFTARDVLDQLDDDARMHSAFFPDFDHGYCYHVDARLSVYGDAEGWAIVIEQLHVNPRWGSFAGVGIQVCFHGNCIDLTAHENHGKQDWITIPNIIADGPGATFLLGDGYSEDVNPAATDLRIRGQVIPIRTDENYYWARNIETNTLTHEQIDQWIDGVRNALPPDRVEAAVEQYEQMRPRVGKFELRPWHVIRGLVPEHREVLLATEDERRVGLPNDLSRLLQLDDWDHPRLLEGELPSGSETFKLIAKRLAAGDGTSWNIECEQGNVHWRNWPLSGSL